MREYFDPEAIKKRAEMRGDTDLQAVKDAAEKFLDYDLAVDFSHPDRPLVWHPFFDNDIVVLNPGERDVNKLILLQIANNPDDLARAKDRMRDIICNCDSASSIFWHVCRPYRLDFFSAVEENLSLEDFSDILSQIWADSRSIHKSAVESKETFVSYFETINPHTFMKAEEYEAFVALPDEVTIYRGIEYDSKKGCTQEMIQGMSWALKPETATYYAKRLLIVGGRTGAVYKAKIKNEDVLAYYNMESPTVIVNSAKLYGIELVKEYEGNEE